MSRQESQNLRSAGLLLTYWCNARCDHCYVLAAPGRSSWMPVEEACKHLAALAYLGVPAEGVHIGGGEPFGDYGRLLRVVRAARAAGLGGVGYVETNGYWATDEPVVRQRLKELQGAGMMQISISADVFHQAYIDPACVSRLWKVAQDVLGPEGVRARRWQFLKSPDDLRGADADERELRYRRALADHGERISGRAARTLAHLLPRRPAEQLEGEACATTLGAMDHVHVDPFGYVFPGTCAGLILGRAGKAHSVSAVVSNPRGRVWRTLVEGGPLALMRYAERFGYRPLADGYADKCHLCSDVRRWMFHHGLGGGELGPTDVYEESR